MANRYGAKLEVGSYTGDGVNYRKVTLGYRPDYLVVKRRIGTASGTWKIKDMPITMTGSFGAGAESATGIVDFLSDGFTVSTSSNTNSTGIDYDYFAISATTGFAFGSYMGTGVDNRDFVDTQKIRFTPEFVYVKSTGANTSRFKTSLMTTESGSFSQAISSADMIQTFLTNGFQLGASTNVNSSAVLYRYIALQADPRYYYTTTFTGNGTSQSISLPWKPDFIFVKCNSVTNFVGLWFSNNPTETQFASSTAPATNAITGYANGVLSIGSNTLANEDGTTVYLMCFRAGEYAPLDLNRS